jgi:type III secretion system FlhB-like substrate exporter
VEKIGNPELYASSTVLGQKLHEDVKKNEELLADTEVNKPKEIIGELTNKILEILPQKMDKDNLIKLAGILSDSLNEKQIMVYFTDQTLQKKMVANSWAGKMKSAPHDYLAVVNSNIAGGKTDRVIRETVRHNVEIQADRSIIDTLTIVREHTGVKNEPFTGQRNVDWLRVYVPLGSELLSAEGFSAPSDQYFKSVDEGATENDLVAETEGKATTNPLTGTKIYEESDKTVFANWTMVDPGNTATIVIRYKLPFSLPYGSQKGGKFAGFINHLFNQEPQISNFSLLVQKQPGSLPDAFYSTLTLSSDYNLLWHYPSDLGIINNGWNIADSINSDKYYKILWQDNEGK